MKCKYFFLFLVLTTFPMILNCSGSENRSTVTTMAGAAGSNSLQAVAEPNPAKVNSVIRATFIGGDKENAYGTVKIYDSTGHEVKDGVLLHTDVGVYEYDWNLCNDKNTKVANGEYFADVKVGLPGDSHTSRIKIAVLR